MIRFYKTTFNLKTRLQEQNLKKILIFYHYHLNLFICCKTKLKMKFMHHNAFVLKNEFLYRVNFFLKGDANIYFKQITFFEKTKKIL